MSSIPLVALQVKTDHPDPLEQYGKVLSLHSLMQQGRLQQQAIQAGEMESRQKQLQLQETEMIMRAQRDAAGDPRKFLASLQGRISPNTYNALVKSDAETREKLASASEAERKALQQKNDQFMGLLNQVKALPDDQYTQAWPQIVQAAERIHPGTVEQYGLDPAQPLPKQAIDQFSIGLITADQYFKQADEDAKAKLRPFQQQKAESDAATAKAESQIKGAEATAMQQYGGMTSQIADSKYRYLQEQLAGRRQISSSDQNFIRAYEKQKLLVPQYTFNLQNAGATGSNGQPSAMARAVADGSMKWSDVISMRTPMSVKKAFLAEVKQVNPSFNSGDFTIEQKVREEATSGGIGKQLLAIGTAREHMKLFNEVAEKLNNNDFTPLNALGNKLGVAFGRDNVTNFNIAKKFFAGEVGKAVAATNSTQSERDELAEMISTSSSWGQLSGALRTADGLLEGKQKATKDWYESGTKGQPNFGEDSSGGPQPGYVRIEASDGSMHDIPRQNLGAAQQRDPGLKVVQ